MSNTPGIVKSLKLGDPIELTVSEIEDWVYTNGKENKGGFQVKVLSQGQGGE